MYLPLLKKLFISRHQDLHNQSFYMVSACSNWIGVRADCLFSVLTTVAAFGFSFLFQFQGKGYIAQLREDKLLLQFYGRLSALRQVR